MSSISSFFASLSQFFSTIVRVVLLSRWMGILKNPQTPKGSKCIVIGNGPSFKDTIALHDEVLQKQPLLCVNSFATTDLYTKLSPVFYILNAPLFFYKEERMSPAYIQLRDTVFGAIATKTNWQLFLMVPFMAKKAPAFQKMLQQNGHIVPLYYNLTPAEGFCSHLFFNTGLGMPRPHNVLIPAIMNLIKLGYNEIYLTGADHSWLSEITVNEENEALVNQKHFYDEQESKPLKMEDYIVRPRRLHEIIHKFQLSFKGYWEIQPYARKKNVQIFNSSEVSMIDAFERRSLKELK